MKNLHRTNSYQIEPGLTQPGPAQSVAYSLRLLKSVKHVAVIAVILLVTGLIFVLSGPAYAAGVKPNDRQVVIYKTPFAASLHDAERLLDWRSPVVSLPFSLPENDWIDGIELLISAQPEGKVNPSTPLLIRFNDAPAVPIYSDGNGFDARIKLDTSFLKGQGNKIRAEYQTPPGKACLSVEHGAWALNIADSQLVIKARTKSRPPSFYDIKSRLTDPATAPRSVAILSDGSDAVRLQALTAQGLSLNMETLPNFRTASGTSDFTILTATRDNLPPYVTERSILKAEGPLIALSQTRSNLLILTGDTEADVLSAAKTFASNPIPPSRHHALGPNGFYGSAAFSRPTKFNSGKTYLGKIGLSRFEHAWKPAPQHIFFDVADPSATAGSLQLKFYMDGDVAQNSSVHVALNGQTLGRFPVSGSRTVQTLDIPQGLLQGLQNHVILTPDLFPQSDDTGCRARQAAPRLSVSSKSILTLESDYTSSPTDLSRFAATGLPFAKKGGTGTTVLVASGTSADRDAALKLLAKLAQASGTGWTEATILDAGSAPWPTHGNVLVIGSDLENLSPVLATAPKSLTAAITGQTRQAPRLMKSAEIAANSMTLLSTGELVTGGVAAIYQDTENSDRLIGVITGSPGQSFSKSVTQLLKPDHWNSLEGSVSRWDQDTVLMAQTAVRVGPQTSDQKPWTRFASTVSAKFNAIEWPDVRAWTDKVAQHFENRSVKTKPTKEAPQETSVVVPSLRTENVAPRRERAMSAVPVPTLKPNATKGVHEPVNSTPALNSLQSRTSFSPRPSFNFGTIKTNIAQTYSSGASRLSEFTNSVLTEQGYASKSNRPGVLLLSLLATFLLLLMAVFMPTRQKS